MENKKHNLLIIDDHPLIIEAYKTAFTYYSKENETTFFSIKTSQDCDSAIELITQFSEQNKSMDIVFLDIRLPPSKDGKFLSGEDLGIKIRAVFPKAKIIIATTFNNNYRIHNIFRNLNPDGFLIKNDITTKELLNAIDVILNDPPYYSKTVIKLLRKQVSNDLLLDKIDRKILYELSIGTRMKDLPNVLPLSIAGIEKRKRHLKQVFATEGLDDKELLLAARKQGFI